MEGRPLRVLRGTAADEEAFAKVNGRSSWSKSTTQYQP